MKLPIVRNYEQHATFLPSIPEKFSYGKANIPEELRMKVIGAMMQADSVKGMIGAAGAASTNDSVRKVDCAMVSGELLIEITDHLTKYVNEYSMRTFGASATPCGSYGFFVYRAPGSHYSWHSDNGHLYPDGEFSYDYPCRNLSMVYYLNEDFTGGNLEIGYRESRFETEHMIDIKPRADHMLLFLSDIRYPHRVMPVITGTRLAIVNWFSLQGLTDSTAPATVLGK